MPDTPAVRYASTGGGEVAYQIVGDGPGDLIFVPTWETNLDVLWEDAGIRRFFLRLASFNRLILFDKRGTGVSSPLPLNAMPTLEQWTDDVGTVLDAAGSEQAVVFGQGAGGAMALLFAATHPERTSALVLLDAHARFVRTSDYPVGLPEHLVAPFMERFRQIWGTTESGRVVAPRADERTLQWYARLQRLAMSPTMAATAFETEAIGTDVRPVLSAIGVPTLVLHRRQNQFVRLGHGEYLADHIQAARFVMVEGDEHLFWLGDTGTVLDAVEHFLTGRLKGRDLERVLATVLFTDIVDSTRRAADLGDRRWREMLDAHDAIAAREVAEFRGHLVKSTGDGLLVTFDGPARAIRAANTIRDRMADLGLQLRAGLHTGEIEIRGDDIGGIGVHIAARISALAGAGEILASRTLKDLTAGSGFVFTDRGLRVLKGVPDEWQVYAVAC